MSEGFKFTLEDGFDATPFGHEDEYDERDPLRVITIEDANARLREWLDKKPVVYSSVNTVLPGCWWGTSFEAKYKGRLVEIEALTKEEKK